MWKEGQRRYESYCSIVDIVPGNTIFRCPLYLEPDIFLHLLLVPDERIPADDGSTENV